MVHLAAATLFAVCLPAIGWQAEALPRLAGTVTRVVDGDTIDVKLTSGPIRVRLYGIDTPERGQPWGREATTALSALVLNRQVELEPFQQDRYDRLIARVFVKDREINGDLIRAGHAWAFRKYMTKSDAPYCAFEESARAAKHGLWSLPVADQLPPWLWRKHHGRTPAPVLHKPTQTGCVREIGHSAV